MTSQEESNAADESPVRGLTRETFEALLARLDPDRERAGELYETVRKKLVRLFEWRGCGHPEELADETINRVARRLAEGAEVWSKGPYGYFFGVAHHVYSEVLRREAREQKARDDGWSPPPPPPQQVEEEAANPRLECLTRCLEGLSQEQRRMVLRYHSVEGHIEARKELSREMGIPLNALRIRVHRTCRKLESCIEQCLQREPVLRKRSEPLPSNEKE
jgi:DNA-directed RNA polymerase specialized sigma24 family protein